MKNLIFILVVSIMISSCAVLTTTQLESIKKYSVATQEYSEYPSLLVKKYVDVQNDIFLLSSPLITNPEKAADKIFENNKRKNEIITEAEKLDLSFKILKEYTKNLEALATTDYYEKIEKNALSIGTNLDTLISVYNNKFDKEIPEGIGSFVYKSIVFVGKRYIDKKRADILKKYIEKGNIIIEELCKSSKEFLEKTVKEKWLSDLDLQLKNVHSGLRQQILVDTTNYPSNAYNIMLIDYKVSELYDEINYLQKMNKSLVSSIEKLYTAHNSINNNVKEKKKMEFILNDVSSFINDVYELIEIHNSFKKTEETE
ncbi:MAG: hypothetical protein IMY71_10845 [Bacteroidetes bacterium]|nr:hypothetical protein [Bacteroidota bacterium]